MYSIEILTGSWYAVSEDMLRCCCHGNDVVRDLFDCRSYIYIIYIMRRFFTELRNSRSKPIRVARMDVRYVRKSEKPEDENMAVASVKCGTVPRL